MDPQSLLLQLLHACVFSVSTGFKVWISFEETCTLETLRRVLPQLISTSMQSDNGRRETEHEGAVEFLRSFIGSALQ